MTGKAVRTFAASLILTGAVGMTGCASGSKEKSAESETVKMASLPLPVQAAFKKAVGAGSIEKIEKETEDGKTIYEVSYEVEGEDRSIKVSDKGDVLEEDVEVKVKSLPPAVSGAVMAKYANAKIKDAERVSEDGATYYELNIKVGKIERELKIDATGKILEDEDKSAEEDEKKESAKK